MTPEAQRIAIAEACGWKFVRSEFSMKSWINSDGNHVGIGTDSLPNYLNDLNAMHDAENSLTTSQMTTMSQHLHRRLGMLWGFATAAQRAEAFLRTIGKWKEAKL